MSAAYRNIDEEQLFNRAEEAVGLLRECRLCPRECGTDRQADERGYCRTGRMSRVASYGPHPGEEAPLRGTRGSGTVFFAGCNLGCIYCQNYDISQRNAGREVDAERLSRIMLRLQERGCHNINLVSPTHVVPQVIEAVVLAAAEGLDLPLVYNTGGYDSVRTLQLLDGIVDIYMPDLKYQKKQAADNLSAAPDYPEVNREAIREMHRQVGDLQIDDRGVAERGLLVRHLILPGGLAATEEAMNFLAEDVSPDTFVNLMAQYYPAHRAREHPPLDRRPRPRELYRAVEAARDAGLHRLYGIGKRL